MNAINVVPIVNAVDRVQRQVNELTVQVGRVDANVGRVSVDVQTTRAELQALTAEFRQFVHQAGLTANVQRSETALGNVEAALDREYGHYKVVRRTSVGTLQAFDIGNVSNDTVQQISEELMIQTPRYWLAPALVALAAWSRDDRELADKSVQTAFTRDRAKTSLFFALVLRRQGRLDASSRWLRAYLSAQDPRALGREFAVVFEAAAHDAFGTHGCAAVEQQLAEWNELLRSDPAVVDAQAQIWVDELTTLRGSVDDSVYPVLLRHSPGWPHYKALLESASAFGFAVEKYRRIADTDTPLVQSVQDQLDDLLEQLVTEYDDEELPFQREVAYHRAVIETGGDTGRARLVADSTTRALDEKMDAVSLQTQIGVHPDEMGVSVGAQKLAIGAGRDDLRTAVGDYANAYRSRFIDVLEIVLAPDHSQLAVAMGFPGWKTDTATTQELSEVSLAETWHRACAGHIEAIRFRPATAVWPVLLACVVAWFGVAVFDVAGGLLALAAFGGAAWWVVRKKRVADERVRHAEAARGQALQYSIDIYRAAVAEFVDARLAYQEADAGERDILELIGGWPIAAGREKGH